MSKTSIDEIESAIKAGHKVEVNSNGSVAIKGAVPASPIQFMYTNYKGERAYRTIIPLRWTWSQGNEWHPEPQWLVEGHDVDKGEHRSFALNDMGQIDGRFGTRPSISQAFDELRASVGGALDHIKDPVKAVRNMGNGLDPLADSGDELDEPCEAQGSMRAVLGEVLQERLRQEAKWGQQNHPDFAEIPAVMSAHPRENALAVIYSIPPPFMAKKACETQADAGKLSWMDILIEEVCELLDAKDKADLRTELIQVAAVATAWIEKIDRERDSEEGR